MQQMRTNYNDEYEASSQKAYMTLDEYIMSLEFCSISILPPAFYQNEILVRKSYKFPPFCDLAVITTSSADEGQLNKISGEIIKDLEEEFTKIGAPVIAYGPFEAPVYKANGRYRKRIIVKCKLNSQIRNVFAKVYFEHSKKSAKDYLSIDFNPSSL